MNLDRYLAHISSNGGRLLADSISLWKFGVESERAFWSNWISTKGLYWPDDFETRTKPRPLPKYLLRYLPDVAIEPVRVLDVGAGPITNIGTFVPDRTSELIAVDPLARYYRSLLEQFDLAPIVPTQFSFVEDLSARYAPSSFDLITCTNALDHAIEPAWGILEMLVCLKIGGVIILQHRENEAEHENYAGLHQWNFTVKDGNFIIFNKSGNINVTELVSSFAKIRCELQPLHEHVGVAVTIKKTLDVPFDQLEYNRKMRAVLLEALLL